VAIAEPWPADGGDGKGGGGIGHRFRLGGTPEHGGGQREAAARRQGEFTCYGAVFAILPRKQGKNGLAAE